MTQLDVSTTTTTTIIIIITADYITYHKCTQNQRLSRRYKDTLNAEADAGSQFTWRVKSELV